MYQVLSKTEKEMSLQFLFYHVSMNMIFFFFYIIGLFFFVIVFVLQFTQE